MYSVAVGLELSVRKTDETPAYCVYAFGPPGAPTGRARLQKDSGDVELTALPDRDDGSSASFYLAHLVPRLQAYHDAGTYPDGDRWTL
ncbi:MAG: hypothetical protein ABEL97_15550 [Salinibacter sp.]